MRFSETLSIRCAYPAEPEWYTLISLLAHEFGGPALIHELSRPYPGYSQKETDDKITHALNDCPGPPTCETIQKNWSGCDCGCGVTTPSGLMWAKKGDEGGGGDDNILKENFVSDSELIPITSFPFGVPYRLRQFIFKVADSHHTTREIVAASILPIIAAAIGTGLRVSPKRSWEVALFIWLAIIEPTGAGKSPVLDTLWDPLFSIQKDLSEEYQAEMKVWKEAEEERKNTKKAKKGENPVHPSENEKPVLRHLFTSDCTVEALGRIFSEDGHGLVIYRDELGGLMLGFNQYKGGKGDDRQKYLSIFDCQPFKIDRKTETLFIKKCGASILGGIQPGLLPQILGEMSFIDGLAQRFLMLHQDTS